MRPLKRLPNSKKYLTYQSYKADLLSRYGSYCAYCEKKDGDLDVEHVEPKSKSGKITDWDNLLLACPTCNRDFKKAFNPDRKGYVFPDHNESYKVFHYRSNGTVGAVTAAAVATRKLCGLNRPGAMSNRTDAFERAKDMRNEVRAGTRMPADVIPWARAMGHWSVWMTVFRSEAAVIALLLDPANFPGIRTAFLHPVNPPIVR
ncbi:MULTISPECIES: HNH endonuclease [Burkholderia]|uniref:HNH endonuclease n=1 Tax=Burkholderia TaxID=32008 RepID=UPI000F02258C|nr:MULTISPECIES: HNH endonuclease [Burkholderia]TCW65020.1 hypothetical protein C5O79_29595 [Burkholderia sp. SRS-25]